MSEKIYNAELEKLKKEVAFWKGAWYELRLTTGKAAWHEYYRGVNDGQNNKVYNLELYKKIYKL